MSVRLAFLFLTVLPMALSAASEPPLAPAPSAMRPEDGTDVGALRAKAERGNAIAQYNLGLAYAQGRGTPADPVEAFVWLTLAAENGSTEVSLDRVLDALTPAQLGAARARLGEVRRNNPSLRSAAATEPSAPGRPGDGTEFAALKAQLEQAQSSLATQSAELAARRVEGATLRIELEKTQSALRQTQTQLEHLKQSAATRTQAQVDAETTANAAAAAEARTQLAALRAQVNTLERERDAALADQSTSAQRAAALASEAASARNDLAMVRTQASEAAAAHRRELETLDQKLVATRTELAQVRAAASAATRQSDELTAQLTATQSALDDLRARAQPETRSDPETPALRARVAALEQELGAALRQRDDATAHARAQSQAFDEERVAWTTKKTRLSAASDDLTVRLAQAEAATRVSVGERDALDARIAELSAKLASAPAISALELEALRDRAAAAEEKVALAQAELASTRQLLAVARARPPDSPSRPPSATNASLPAGPRRPDTSDFVARAPTPVASQPAASTPMPRVHRIALGETLSGISLRYYGTASRWREIFAANQDVLRDERSLVAGRTLRIP